MEELNYADMIEIPVDTCKVVTVRTSKRRTKRPSVKSMKADELKRKAIGKVNGKLDESYEAQDLENGSVSTEQVTLNDTENGKDIVKTDKGFTSILKKLFGSKRKLKGQTDVTEPIADGEITDDISIGLDGNEIKEDVEADPLTETSGLESLADALTEAKEDAKALETEYKEEENSTNENKNYVPTVSVETKKPSYKTKWKTVGKVAMASLLFVAVISATFLTERFALGKYFSSMFPSGAGKEKAVSYTDLELTLPCQGAVTGFNDGVIVFKQKGSVYPSMSGTVCDCKYENGKYSVEIENENNLKTVFSGLDRLYFSKGEKVYQNVPLGYSNGEEYTLSLYSSDKLLTEYELGSEKVVWKKVADGIDEK